ATQPGLGAALGTRDAQRKLRDRALGAIPAPPRKGERCISDETAPATAAPAPSTRSAALRKAQPRAPRSSLRRRPPASLRPPPRPNKKLKRLTSPPAARVARTSRPP